MEQKENVLKHAQPTSKRENCNAASARHFSIPHKPANGTLGESIRPGKRHNQNGILQDFFENFSVRNDV
jgi:hypothetical protein